jgi:hypothetical protein
VTAVEAVDEGTTAGGVTAGGGVGYAGEAMSVAGAAATGGDGGFGSAGLASELWMSRAPSPTAATGHSSERPTVRDADLLRG